MLKQYNSPYYSILSSWDIYWNFFSYLLHLSVIVPEIEMHIAVSSNLALVIASCLECTCQTCKSLWINVSPCNWKSINEKQQVSAKGLFSFPAKWVSENRHLSQNVLHLMQLTNNGQIKSLAQHCILPLFKPPHKKINK